MTDYTGFINKPFSVSGTGDIGSCCSCDMVDSVGNETHITQHELFACLSPGCPHYCCAKHRQSCGFCEGCCAKKHGLAGHLRVE